MSQIPSSSRRGGGVGEGGGREGREASHLPSTANRRSGALNYSNSLLASPSSSSRLRGPSTTNSSVLNSPPPVARKNSVQERNIDTDRTLQLTSAKKLQGPGLPRKSLTVKTRITQPTQIGSVASPNSATPTNAASHILGQQQHQLKTVTSYGAGLKSPATTSTTTTFHHHQQQSERHRDHQPSTPQSTSTSSTSQIGRGLGVPLSSLSTKVTHHRRTTSLATTSSTSSPSVSTPLTAIPSRKSKDALTALSLSPNTPTSNSTTSPLSPSSNNPPPPRNVFSPTHTRADSSPAPPIPTPLSPRSEKRPGPPARFSSNGVATATGPPPSLAFRKMEGYSYKRSQTPSTTTTTTNSTTTSTSTTATIGTNATKPLSAAEAEAKERERIERRKGLRKEEEQEEEEVKTDEEDNERTIRVEDVSRSPRKLRLPPMSPPKPERLRRNSQQESPLEDPFFQLARTQTGERPDEEAGPKEASRVRASLTYGSVDETVAAEDKQRRPSTFSTQRSSLPARHYEGAESATSRFRHSAGLTNAPSIERLNQSFPSGEEPKTPRLKRPSSIYNELSPRAGSPKAEQQQQSKQPQRQSLLRNQETAIYVPTVNHPQPDRRDLDTESQRVPRTPEKPQQSQLAKLVESDSKRKLKPTAGGEEESVSSISTTAPSTVWDELDDLKSRIRRLESGRSPAAPTGSSERPRTATTTATTLSSSPRNTKSGPSPTPAGVLSRETTGNQPQLQSSPLPPPRPIAHPLLEAALLKTQNHLSPDSFRSLQALTNDALSLASLVTPTPTSQLNASPAQPNQAATERQIRRKVDSMCRGLTELCLALTEQSQQGSMNRSPLPTSSSRLSVDREQRPGSRVDFPGDLPSRRAETSLGQAPSRTLFTGRRVGSTQGKPSLPLGGGTGVGRSASVLQLGESLISPTNRLATRSSLVGKRIGQIGEEEGGYGTQSAQSSPGYSGGLRAPSRANTSEGMSVSFGSYLSTTRERERERELERERERERELGREMGREGSYYSGGGGVRRLGSVSGASGGGYGGSLERSNTTGGYSLEKVLQGRLEDGGRLRSGSLVGLRERGRY
ncbi:hypothetical protein BJ508DRAFT_327673 [Ascobolus immersus RN42]|uniref:Uncharacterized protein n=1 Tax=Ascobolus immersus RN42 TaxID=1160509 RepID=A0A3N4I246_ASCIM|nr:hypothetical protein BJ508DRAFT_327673 [Ascobolus immersus RN42]